LPSTLISLIVGLDCAHAHIIIVRAAPKAADRFHRIIVSMDALQRGAIQRDRSRS